MITFKSIPANFKKEKSGQKPNTLRKDEPGDPRFIRLRARLPGALYIRIVNSETGESFTRSITDRTYWEGWWIISWRHEA
jgi:hypothetical protein